jgi:hypothetical protein
MGLRGTQLMGSIIYTLVTKFDGESYEFNFSKFYQSSLWNWIA